MIWQWNMNEMLSDLMFLDFSVITEITLSNFIYRYCRHDISKQKGIEC
jgi:hypothetical protein